MRYHVTSCQLPAVMTHSASHAQTHTPTHAHIRTHTHAHTHAHTRTHMHTHTHTHTRAHTHVCTHTHTHTQVWRYDGTVECYTEGHLPLAIWAGTVLAIYTLFSLLIPIFIHVLLAVVSAWLKGQQRTHVQTCTHVKTWSMYKVMQRMRGEGEWERERVREACDIRIYNWSKSLHEVYIKLYNYI